MLVNTNIETELWRYPSTTIRVWLLLYELTQDYGNPLIMSFADISKYSNVCKRISPRSVSTALNDLHKLKLINLIRRGNVSIIALNGLPRNIAE